MSSTAARLRKQFVVPPAPRGTVERDRAWRYGATLVKRFPTRTLILMVLALLSFAWFWWQTHRSRPAPGPRVDVRVVPTPADADGAPGP